MKQFEPFLEKVRTWIIALIAVIIPLLGPAVLALDLHERYELSVEASEGLTIVLVLIQILLYGTVIYFIN